MKQIPLILFSLFTYHFSLPQGHVQIQYDPGHPANILKPALMLGAAFDGHEGGDIDHILKPENVQAMLSVGLQPVSYRLRTELGVEAWHWNPKGRWSEVGKQEGYWISDTTLSSPIQLSNGYRLPRRGNTHDQANDDSYSRLDDDDSSSFWKSNPYLDELYTHEPNTLHPQWVVIDLGRAMDVNAIRILWANPYALSYKADYADDIGDDYFDPLQPGLWHELTKGNIADNKQDKDKIVFIADKPTRLRFIRITMSQSSGTAEPGCTDIRDQLGFAIREIEAGLLDKKNHFHDYVDHAPKNNKQSIMHVSSTDPWHRAIDIDPHTEQAGIDRFFTCGLTRNQPAMIPIGLLYDTPENMLALVHYLSARHYPVNELEMGEEPEGQLFYPEDYAALYYQFATGIKKIIPSIHMGGPCFAALATTAADEYSFTESQWTTRFLQWLANHKSSGLFNFFSFEWYPFDDVCAPTAPQLAMQPSMLDKALKNFQDHVLPAGVPIYVTEYGYSAHSGLPEVEIEAALMYADILGRFLTIGGNKSFLYGYEPSYPDQNDHCDWGNNMLFGLDGDGNIEYRTAAFYGMQMITQHWVQPGDVSVEIYPANCSIKNKNGLALITAYAIKRNGNNWSIMLINKDPEKSWDVDLNIFNTAKKTTTSLNFPLHCYQYSSLQYKWKRAGSEGHPSLNLPPTEQIINGGSSIKLPPYSMTILSN